MNPNIKKVILVGTIFLIGILLGGYIQKSYNRLFKKEIVNNDILPANQPLYNGSLEDSLEDSLENNDELFTADFYIVLHKEYEESEEYSASINKALLYEFGRKGLCFEYQEHEIFGTISYPIPGGHILSDVKYKLEDNKLFIYIITKSTNSFSVNVASNKEVIFITLNNINKKPSKVTVYLNNKALITLGGIHDKMITWN